MEIKNECFNSECPNKKELESLFKICDEDSFLRVKTSGGKIPLGEAFWESRPVEIISVKDAPRFTNLRWIDWTPENAKKVNSILRERFF